MGNWVPVSLYSCIYKGGIMKLWNLFLAFHFQLQSSESIYMYTVWNQQKLTRQRGQFWTCLLSIFHIKTISRPVLIQDMLRILCLSVPSPSHKKYDIKTFNTLLTLPPLPLPEWCNSSSLHLYRRAKNWDAYTSLSYCNCPHKSQFDFTVQRRNASKRWRV